MNIAQVFARSGMTEVTWADTGLDDITKLEGKKVGVWLGGNEHKLYRGADEERHRPARRTSTSSPSRST